MQPLPQRHTPYIALLVIITIVSRFVFLYACDISFDYRHLFVDWHLLAPEQLKDNLAESLWYLHCQPPLYNLFTGLSLKLFPENYRYVWQYSFILWSLGTAIVFYYSLFRMSGKQRLSFTVAALFLVSPAVVLYENMYFYPLQAMALLTASMYCLIELLRTEKKLWGHLLFVSLAVLCLSISMFHLVWMASIAVFLLVFRRRLWRTVLVTSIVPLLLVTAWYAKTKVMFGQFTSSTWMGSNISRIILFDNYENGDTTGLENVSDTARYIAMKGPFKCIAVYERYLPQPPAKYPGVAVLHDPLKSNLDANYNNLQYIYVSEKLKEASMASLKASPKKYLRRTVTSNLMYFSPAASYFHLDSNRMRIQAWYDIYNGGNVPVYKDYIWLSNIILMLLYVAVFGLCALKLFRRLRSRAWGWQDIVILYTAYNILFFLVTGNMLELPENMRFRFQVIPMFILMGVWCLPSRKKKA